MQILHRLVFAQSILIINLKLCSTRLYLKPDDDFGFDLENSFDPDQNNDLVIVLPIQRIANESTEILNKAIQKDNLPEHDDNSEEADSISSDFETQEAEESGLEIGDLNLNNAQKDMLRKRWRSTCDRKASRTCTTACKDAYKIVCGSFNCRRRMKRDFKRECKRNCKARFISSISSADTSE